MGESLENRDLFAADFGFATGLGGAGRDAGFAVALDGSGGLYTTGMYSDMSEVAGEQLTGRGAFVSKQDRAGNVIWARGLTGDVRNNVSLRMGRELGDGAGNGIAVDADGNVFVTGRFDGTADFDPGPEVHAVSASGQQDIFVLKLDGDGNLIWVQTFGHPGGSREQGSDIAIDSNGSVFVAGSFGGTVDFDSGEGLEERVSHGGLDAFLLKISSDGDLEWARALGSVFRDEINGIAVDRQGDVYATGTSGPQFVLDSSEKLEITRSGYPQAFTIRLSGDGDLVWAKRFSSPDWSEGEDIAVDAAGHVYAVGRFSQVVDLDPSSGVHSLVSDDRGTYVVQLTGEGDFSWASSLGQTKGQSISVDASNTVYVGGSYACDVAIDTPSRVFHLTSPLCSNDAFVARLSQSGQIMDVLGLGGDFSEQINDIEAKDSGEVVATGYFSTIVDFAPGDPVFELTAGGNLDVFTMRLDFIEPLAGDVDGNGIVDVDDFVTLASHFGEAENARRDQGDLDGDGAVDFSDLVILSQNFARSA